MQFDSAESYLDYLDSDSYQAPVAVLTDYCMPGLSGFQLIRKVRERLPHQKAVIISGTPSDELGEALDELICFSLTKPFKIEQLFRLLEALLTCDRQHDPQRSTLAADCCCGLEHGCPFRHR